MFKGEHHCALDDKGRLNFPAKFRAEMGGAFTVTRWLDGCLVAFPQKQWERVETMLATGSLVKGHKARRMLLGSAADVTPDKQGRILLSPELRRHAKLDKDIAVVGVGDMVEIWDAETWHAQDEALGGEEMAEVMMELGL